MWLLLMVMIPPVVVNFWLRMGRPRLTMAEHQAIVAGYQDRSETMDVFLPSCGEPVAVLDNTFRYVSALDWRGPKTVYVLDDSAREKVRDLADQYDFEYIVRPNPGEMKKAGNLTFALGVSSGDFIAVIDADFAVRPEFLYETMPYFSDPKIGIVQTAQYYDVTNRSFSYIQRYAGTLQEIFFRFIQPARDRYKAAICAGTNLVYRRAAVVAVFGDASPAAFPALETRRERRLPAFQRGAFFRGFHVHGDEAAALHAAGVSVSGAFLRLNLERGRAESREAGAADDQVRHLVRADCAGDHFGIDDAAGESVARRDARARCGGRPDARHAVRAG